MSDQPWELDSSVMPASVESPKAMETQPAKKDEVGTPMSEAEKEFVSMARPPTRSMKLEFDDLETELKAMIVEKVL